jgi:hypothetical protein
VPKFGYQLAQCLGITRRIVKLKGNVLSLNVASRAQSFAKPLQERVGSGSSGNPKDAMELRRRLRMRGVRPRQRTADQRHEISPSDVDRHSQVPPMRPWISGASFQDDFAELPQLLQLSHSVPPARTTPTARSPATSPASA